jgi:hypothetical protein
MIRAFRRRDEQVYLAYASEKVWPTPIMQAPSHHAGIHAKVRELTIIALVSCFSLGLAWAYEADLFAMFFAAAAAMAGVEAVRRSL